MQINCSDELMLLRGANSKKGIILTGASKYFQNHGMITRSEH